MKAMRLAITLGIILIGTILVQAADMTTSTPVNQFDVRHMARAIVSHRATQEYSGSYNYVLEMLDGSKVVVSGDYRGRFYGENGQQIFKYFELSIRRNDGPTAQYVGEPLALFPYPIEGVPVDFSIYIWGIDNNGEQTQWGQYSTHTWNKGNPIVYWMTPGALPIFIPFDLAGRDANGVGLVVDGWGGLIPYDGERGGFSLWVDPTQILSAKIVDRYNFNATIVSLPPIRYDELPENTAPNGSSPNFRWINGINTVEFNQNNFYEGRDQYFNTNVVENGQSLQAAVYVVQESDLGYSALYGALLDFSGRLQIEAFNAPGQKGVIIRDQVWNDPTNILNFDVPQGYWSLMITIIKNIDPVAIPNGWNYDANSFNLIIGRAWSGGKG